MGRTILTFSLRMNTRNHVLVGSLLTVVLVGHWWVGNGFLYQLIGLKETDAARDERIVTELVKNQVLDRLISPGSAIFNTVAVHAAYSEKKWWVSGTVDSQNRFGALLRSRFMATVVHSDGTYKLEGPLVLTEKE